VGPEGEEDDITGQMREAYWSIYDGAAARASVRAILVRLPRIVGQVGRLAWQASPRATVTVVVLQLTSAAMAAFGLLASVAVLHQLFAQGRLPTRSARPCRNSSW
jgi:ATP-binding cassette, subfamily B, bacterial